MKRFNSARLAAAAAVLTLFFSCSREKKETFNLYNWSYYTPDSVLEQFAREYNCTVKVDYFDSNEMMYAKLRAGAKGYDLTIPSQDYTSIMIKQGMVQKIDHSQFPNAKYINPEALKKAAAYDPDMTWSVPYCLAASGISVNRTKVKDYEKSYSIFSRADLGGHMTMMDDMRVTMGSALRHLGYSLNTTDEAQLREAAGLIIREWRPNLVKFDAEGYGKSFASGDFWVCDGYAEIVFAEVPEEKHDEVIDFFVPEEGSAAYLDSMVILKDARHYDLAMKFIDFSHRPEIYAQFCDALKFPSYINTEAGKYTKKKPMYPAELLEKCELKMDVGEDLSKYDALWQEIRFSAE
ncbi:MAG: extracellular solute-binding protein [Treponema sp.]|nr:extracellular solute-binding protein [Treponema sp.]